MNETVSPDVMWRDRAAQLDGDFQRVKVLLDRDLEQQNRALGGKFRRLLGDLDQAISALKDSAGAPDQWQALRKACADADLPGTVEHFRRSLEIEDLINSDAGWQRYNITRDLLLSDSARLITTPQRYLMLGEGLRLLTGVFAANPGLRSRTIELRSTLAHERYRSVLRPLSRPESQAMEDLLVVTPISLRADARLFPLMEETPQVKRMIQADTGDVELMRSRIKESTGVIVPGIRISPYYDDLRTDGHVLQLYELPIIHTENSTRPYYGKLGEGGYLLLLNEIVMDRGAVPYTDKFCPDASACRALRIQGRVGTNPATGKQGMWLSPSEWKQAEQEGLQLWDGYEHMLRHVEAVIRRNLVMFVGVQEVQSLLDQWKAENREDQQALIETALPDDTARLRLVRVFRRLVREGVSIRDLDAILRTFAETNSKYLEIAKVVESVRMAVRPALPGGEQVEYTR